MGRYSPTVVPEVPDPLAVVNSAFANYLGYRSGERAERGVEQRERELDIRQKESQRRLEDQELARYRQGFRRGRKPEPVKDEEVPSGLRRGAHIGGEGAPAVGLQPGEREGIPGLKDSLQGARAEYEPSVRTKPGALVPELGIFADRPLLGMADRPEREPPPPEVSGLEQVTPDYYFDPAGTQEARTLGRQQTYEGFRQALSQAYERQDRQGVIDAAVAAGYAPEEAEAMSRGVPLRGDPEEEIEQRLALEEGLQEIRAKYRTTTTGRGTGFSSMAQALNFVQDSFSEYGQDALGKPVWQAYGLTDQEMLKIAEQLFRGELNPSDIMDPGQPWNEGSRGGVVGGEYLPPSSPFASLLYQPEGGGLFPATESEAEPDMRSGSRQMQQAVGFVRDIPEGDRYRELLELGFIDDQIQAIAQYIPIPKRQGG